MRCFHSSSSSASSGGFLGGWRGVYREGELISSQVALCIYFIAQYNTRGSLRVGSLDRTVPQKVCYTY